jgi:hypothetical protein
MMQVSFGIRRGARHTEIADWLVCFADSDGGVVWQLTGRSSHCEIDDWTASGTCLSFVSDARRDMLRQLSED